MSKYISERSPGLGDAAVSRNVSGETMLVFPV